MNIEQEILKLLSKNKIEFDYIAEKLSTNNKNISAQRLFKKLSNKTITFDEIQEILDILGCCIEFQEKR